MKTFNEIVNEAGAKHMQTHAESSMDPKEMVRQIGILNEMLSPKYRTNDLPSIDMREALATPDVSILFPKAISDVLIRPREPIMIGQTLLSKTVQAPNVKSFEFPVMGAIRAFDMSESQEYREQQPSFGEHFTEIRVNKTGLIININEDVIKDSMWDVMGLMVEAAGFAMMRKKEEKIFDMATDQGHVVFDNLTDDPNYWTGGRGTDGKTRNFSVGFDDLLDTLGTLVAHEYIPTDVVMHPLAWMIFAKDPILRAQFLTNGQIGQTVWKNMPNFDQSANVPWNIAYQVTPFMPMSKKAHKKVNTSGTALESVTAYDMTATTDVMVIDRNKAILVLQKEPMGMDSYSDFVRETSKIKFRERYGLGILNQGRSIAVIKNVRLEQNYAPVATFAQVTPA